MLDDNISKWDLLGLLDDTRGLGTYTTAKLLNNQSSLLTWSVKNKKINPSCTFAQLCLPIASRVGRAIGANPKIEILDTTTPRYHFYDNPDLRVVPRVHTLETPVAHKYFGEDLSVPPTMEMEIDYCGVLSDEIIRIYTEILEDETITNLFIEYPIAMVVDRNQCIEENDCTELSYATTYAIYRQGDN